MRTTRSALLARAKLLADRLPSVEFELRRSRTSGEEEEEEEDVDDDGIAGRPGVMRQYYVDATRKHRSKKRARRVSKVIVGIVLAVVTFLAWYRRQTTANDVEQSGFGKRFDEARKELEEAKRREAETETEVIGEAGRDATRTTTFGREAASDDEYGRETERLMEELADRIKRGRYNPADFNLARDRVRERRRGVRDGTNTVRVSNAEVLRLRDAKRQLHDDFIRMGPTCRFDESGMSRESVHNLREECKAFYREETKRMEKIPLLDGAAYSRRSRHVDRRRLPIPNPDQFDGVTNRR